MNLAKPKVTYIKKKLFWITENNLEKSLATTLPIRNGWKETSNKKYRRIISNFLKFSPSFLRMIVVSHIFHPLAISKLQLWCLVLECSSSPKLPLWLIFLSFLIGLKVPPWALEKCHHIYKLLTYLYFVVDESSQC